MGISKAGIVDRFSVFLNSKLVPFMKKTLTVTANLVTFTSRFVYTLIANLLVLILLVSGIVFGIVVVVLFGLLIRDFFMAEDDEVSKGSEFISKLSEELFSILAFVFESISNLLEYISTNYFLQGIAFFLLFIVVTNRLVNAGIRGYLDRAKIALRGCKNRFIWAFEPISLFQPKKDGEEE